MKEKGEFMLRTYGKKPYQVAVIHGGPGAIGSLGTLAHHLSSFCSVVEPLQSKYTIAESIEELNEQLKEVTTVPITLLGHSWGALLVMLYTAKYPNLVDQLVLVGAPPLKDQYVDLIMDRRLSALTDHEIELFTSILQHLENSLESDSLLEQLNYLTSKTDNYDLDEEKLLPDFSLPVDSKMNSLLWNEAKQLRSSGELLTEIKKITCPIYILQGEFDPHPLSGVIEPLSEIDQPFDAYLIKKCGHNPYYEREAADEFYRLLYMILKKEIDK